MTDQNGTSSAHGQITTAAESTMEAKGKGKAVDISQDMDEDSSDEETGAEEEVQDQAEDEDEDNMEEIDTDNIISDGRRTRGKTIDFAEAAKNAGDELDDDEEDDDDFEEKEEDQMHD